MRRFDFEKLEVFRVALEMAVRVDPIADHLPRRRSYMRDQLRRAANSVPLNIAEGAGEFSPAEKARFYRIARRSATEVAAQLVLAERLGVAGRDEVNDVRTRLLSLVSMLTRLAANAERRRLGRAIQSPSS